MAEPQGATAPSRLVLDTNVVVAGLLWSGAPRQVLDLAIDEAVKLYSSTVLLDELTRTLAYPKFGARITRFGTSVDALIAHYTALLTHLTAAATMPRVSRDPDDDHVIACAVAAGADALVSGDHDLLVLGEYRGVRIVTAREALALFIRV